jgi:hypothetical protein
MTSTDLSSIDPPIQRGPYGTNHIKLSLTVQWTVACYTYTNTDRITISTKPSC